ncbi:MAG: helix-turn-helix transcriptional regulator, partial [Alphaproteobacteria bacterium]|nr:helix-turn-helix transcriptional regulator [Alphaproteobacteria bacterium]
VLPAMWRLDDALDDAAASEIAVAAADLLMRASGIAAAMQGKLHLVALSRVREFIRADPTTRHPIATLEKLSGLDRWALARQFRAAFGTSPSSFRTMRQLDAARLMMRDGHPLAEAAAAAGFADQSHMSRMFKRAYGLTPAGWTAALARR